MKERSMNRKHIYEILTNVYMSKTKYIIYKYITKHYGKLIILKHKYMLINNMRYMCS